jgi:integrase
MRAALNLALADGYVTSDAAWRQALRPTGGADRRRTLYLSKEQRRALIEALPADAAAFVRGLSLLPLRPGALAALTVADFNAKQGALRIGSDKAGAQRVIPLPDAVVTLLKAQARDKLPSAPLFARWDGSAWSKDAWKGPLKAAAMAAGLPAETTAYTLRHSTITDLATAGLDLFSVAALAGTSVAMIEKHYGHLQAERARAALAGLAL